MSQRIRTLLENESIQGVLQENEEAINKVQERIENFPERLKTYVAENIEEFISPDLETTFKNIRTFAEAAQAQYIAEVTSLYGEQIFGDRIMLDASISDYL